MTNVAARKTITSASDNYAAKLAEIETHLARIRAEIETHREMQADDPGNWGYSGDLGSVVTALDGIRLAP